MKHIRIPGCFSLLAFILVMAAPSLAQTNPCSCDDAKDLINRINEINAAISQYQNQIAGMEAKEKRDGEPFMYTGDIYKQTLQARLQETFNGVTHAKARKGTGETLGDCKIEINAPTECLRKILDKHEAVHSKSCQEKKALFDWMTGKNDYKEKMRLVDVAKEEIAGYTAELNYIMHLMQSFPKLCLPKPWFGRITTTRTFSTKTPSTSETVNESATWILMLGKEEDDKAAASPAAADPAIAALVKKSQEIMKRREAMGYVSTPVITYAQLNIDRNKTWKGSGFQCCGTDTGVTPDIDLFEEEIGSGTSMGNVTVLLTPGLSLDFSDVTIRGKKRTKKQVNNSPCEYEKSSESSREENLALKVQTMMAPGGPKKFGEMELLAGSKTVPIDGGKITYTWDLKRFIK